MKNVLKIIALLFSFYLIAENTPIAPIAQENENIFVFDGDIDSKAEKIINFFDDPDNIFATGVATIGTLQILDLISVIAHECGHALPAFLTGNYFKIGIKHTGSIVAPFEGCCWAQESLLMVALGPIAGITSTYFQCVAIKALYDHHIQNKSFAESWNQALKFPSTFFNNAMNTGEKYCSALLNSQSMPSAEKKPSSSIINTLLFFRTVDMIAEAIYGFLPYKMPDNQTGDGELIWQMLLGKQPPTFEVRLYTAAVAIMAAPVAIGALKALYKKVNEKYSTTEKTEDIQQPA